MLYARVPYLVPVMSVWIEMYATECVGLLLPCLISSSVHLSRLRESLWLRRGLLGRLLPHGRKVRVHRLARWRRCLSGSPRQLSIARVGLVVQRKRW